MIALLSFLFLPVIQGQSLKIAPDPLQVASKGDRLPLECRLKPPGCFPNRSPAAFAEMLIAMVREGTGRGSRVPERFK